MRELREVLSAGGGGGGLRWGGQWLVAKSTSVCEQCPVSSVQSQLQRAESRDASLAVFRNVSRRAPRCTGTTVQRGVHAGPATCARARTRNRV